MLCKQLVQRGEKGGFAVFVSNDSKKVPLWAQSAGEPSEDGLVVWDYHVFFIWRPSSECKKGGSEVYDLDTTCGFPVDADDYIKKTFRPMVPLKPDFKRLFRVVSAEEFVKTFASDRSHMLDKRSGKYQMPPPSYPAISTSECKNNLMDSFVNMKDKKLGETMNLHKLQEFVS